MTSMKWVISMTGQVHPATVQAEIEVRLDRLPVLQEF